MDDSASERYSCLVRQEIERVWDSGKRFIRPGDSWFRNPEFGRSIELAEKRGRGNGQRVVRTPHNPHHYERYQKKLTLAAAAAAAASVAATEGKR